MNGGPDEAGGPKQSRMNADAGGRDGGLHLIERPLHRVGDVQGVGAKLAVDEQQHARLAVDRPIADLRLGGLDHAGHVFQPNRRAVVMGDNGFAEGIGRQRLAPRLDDDPLRRSLHKAGPTNAGRLAGGVQDVVQGKPVGRQPLRRHLNLQLLHLAAEDGDPRHAGDGQQPRAHGPVGEGPQLHQRKLFRSDAGDQHHAGGARERRHGGSRDTLRQLLRGLGQALGDHLTGAEDIGLVAEENGDDGESLDRL